MNWYDRYLLVYKELIELFSSICVIALTRKYEFELNSREQAIMIIITLSFLLMLLKKDIREEIFGVIKILINKHFIRAYIEITIYTLLITRILYKIGFWKFSYTKDTIIWIVFSALVLSFKTADAKGDRKIFYEILRDTINVAVVIEFVSNIYTFNIILEILMIIIIVFVGTMLAFTEAYPEKVKGERVNKLFNIINVYIGLNIFVYVVIEIIQNYNSLLTLDTLRVFLLPIIYTLLFMPYLFILMVRVIYDQLSVPIKLNKVANRWVKRYFMTRAYLFCRVNIDKIMDLKINNNHLIINMITISDVNYIFSSKGE